MQDRQFRTKLIDQAETSGFGHSWLTRPGLVGGVRMVFPTPALAEGVCRLVLVPCGGSLAHSMCAVLPARMTGFICNIFFRVKSSMGRVCCQLDNVVL